MRTLRLIATIILYILVVGFITAILSATLTGCAPGHSIMTVDRGVGLHFRIPLLLDGSTDTSLIDLKMGSIDSATALIRGGTTFSANNAKGGGLGSLSTGDYFIISSNPGLTEGYLRDVMSSPHVDAATKAKLAEYLLRNQGAPAPVSASAVSVSAAAASGSNPPEVKFATTGFDKIADTVPEVVKPIANTVEHVTTETVNAVPGYLKSYQVLLAITGASVLILIVVLGTIFFKWFFGLFKKKTK